MNYRLLFPLITGLNYLLVSFPVMAQQETTGTDTAPAWQQLQEETLTPPISYQEMARQRGNVLDLSLRDAIRLALVNNLTIAIENYNNEDLTRGRIVETRGYYVHERQGYLQQRIQHNQSGIPDRPGSFFHPASVARLSGNAHRAAAEGLQSRCRHQ